MSLHDSKTILAYGLFTNDVRATVSREQLYQWIALATLSFSEDSLTLQELQTRVSLDLNLPNPVPVEHLQNAITRAAHSGLVEVIDDDEKRYTITEARRAALHRAERVYSSNRRAFCEHLGKHCADFLGEALPQEVLEILADEVEYLFEEAFCRFSLEDAQSFVQQHATVVDELHDISAPVSVLDSVSAKLRKVVGEKLPRVRISVTRSQIIQEAVKEAFWDLPKQALRHVISLHHRVIYSYILRLDPNLQKFDRYLLAQRVLYLDTNVVLDYMFPVGRFHEPIREVLELSRELGCSLCVAQPTLSELEYHIFTKAKDHLRLFLSGDEKMKMLVLSGAGAVVLGGYVSTTQEVSYEGFARYLEAYRDLGRILKQHGISIAGPSTEEIKADPAYVPVLSKFNQAYDYKRAKAIEAGRDPKYSMIPAEHDAQLFVLVHMLRRELPGDAMGSKTWLLTRDFSVFLRAQRWMRFNYPQPIAKSTFDWGSFLIGFKSPDVTSVKFDDYVKLLLGSQLGLLTEDTGVDVDFLAILSKNDLLIPQLSAGSPEQVTEHVRAAQESQEMQGLVRSIMDVHDEDQREILKTEAVDVLKKLMAGVDERSKISRDEARRRVAEEDGEQQVMAVRESALEQRIQVLSEQVTQLAEALSHVSTTKSELESKVAEYESSWLMRLIRAVRSLLKRS